MKKILKCFSLILILMFLFSLKNVKADGGYVIPEETVQNLIDNHLPQKGSTAPEKMCLKFVSTLWKTASPETPWPTSLICCANNHSLAYGISGTVKKRQTSYFSSYWRICLLYRY